MPVFTRATAAVLTTSALAVTTLAVTTAPATAIHGGQNTTVTDHPYAMLLTTPDGLQACGGTLVAPTKVLTAAHCVDDATATDMKVIGGRTELASTKGTVRAISSIALHPGYDQTGLVNDAAVITLAQPMPYATLPVAGPKDKALYRVGSTAKAVGWGRIARDTNATRLKSASLTLSPIAQCDPFTDSTDTLAKKVCGTPPAGTQNSICRGDSGGPLVAGGKVIGIVTTGNKYCDSELLKSVFVRTSAVAADLGLPVN
ncbi:S1 family peptidase [Streptomyces qinzhouensis]|uniref:Serine protease n=1 Tax=Streptomyces qinzhouensis TaxID=2599401 RepID=A0A5B8JR04_9ACTN|nr:serine protease [Streptomyces qinzhouensis]QDY80173.1 serine protease [Streptomyces qinzhouensis]